MTCIVGVEHAGKVYIGGDSAGVVGLDVSVRADEKVFRRGSYVFGFTSSFRMGQILRYCGKLPRPFGTDLHKFMCTVFVDSLVRLFKKYRFGTEKKGGTFLVGVNGSLFEIQSDFQVAKSVDSFTAIGCGDMIALGSLYATRTWKDPNKRIMNALSASERYSGGVCSPFRVVSG